MVSRKWDVHNTSGTYMSTDFILSDEKANLMHCFSSHNKSYKFVDMQEGSLYLFKRYKVHSNRKNFRILQDGVYMLEFDGNTSVAKASGDVSRYVRYPFQFSSFEQLAPTNNQYVVDLMGYVTCVGDVLTKSNGATTVEFNFTNERGRQIRVTLWGKLGKHMIKKKLENPGPYALILTAMSSKIYLGELGVSSSSSTQLLDTDDIPALQQFKAALSGRDLTQISVTSVKTIPQVTTLAELLEWGRMKADAPNDEDGNVVFTNSVEIIGVRTSSGWYLVTCNSGRCLKGLTREDGGFKCEGCNKTVLYPRFRFKLQLDIRDESASTVVVLFDHPAERLLDRTAKSMMEEELQDGTRDDVLPPVLQNLIGSRHTFEIKGHTYYRSGTYEAFNCSEVILPVPDPKLLEAGGSQHPASKLICEPSSNTPKDSILVVTPLKKSEPKKRKAHVNDSEPLATTAEKNKAILVLDGVGDTKRIPTKAQTGVNKGNAEEPATSLTDNVSEEPRRSPCISKKGRFVVESDSDVGEEGADVFDEDA